MGKCLLPFTLDVEIRAYQNKSFPLEIIKANIKDYDIWLCNRFINCFVNEENMLVNSFDKNVWSTKDGLAHIEKKSYTKEEFDCKSPDIIVQNREKLRKGIYIIGNYDEYYIGGKEVYGNKHFNHDYVIFGYNDNAKVFKSAAYMEDRQYRYFDITYDDYYKSISLSEYTSWMSFIKIEKTYSPAINILHIKKEIENYILSKEDDIVAPGRKLLFGMEAWNRFARYICETCVLFDFKV